MPTPSKPKLKETASVWQKPSRRIQRELTASKNSILQTLGFYHEHDRPEDFGGKFKKQLLTHEKELLSEIAGALTLAAAISASVSRPVLLATVEEANNLQQSWRFDWEPPKAVLRDVWTIDWILGC